MDETPAASDGALPSPPAQKRNAEQIEPVLRSPSMNWNQSARRTIRTSLGGGARRSSSSISLPKLGATTTNAISAPVSTVPSPPLRSLTSKTISQHALSAFGLDGAQDKNQDEARAVSSTQSLQSPAVDAVSLSQSTSVTNNVSICTTDSTTIDASGDGQVSTASDSDSEASFPRSNSLNENHNKKLKVPALVTAESTSASLVGHQAADDSSGGSYEPIEVDSDQGSGVLLNVIEQADEKEASGLESGEVSESTGTSQALATSTQTTAVTSAGDAQAEAHAEDEAKRIHIRYSSKGDIHQLLKEFSVDSTFTAPKRSSSGQFAYAFVDLTTTLEARRAFSELHLKRWHGKKILVQWFAFRKNDERLSNQTEAPSQRTDDDAANASDDSAPDEGEIRDEVSGSDEDAMMQYADSNAGPGAFTAKQSSSIAQPHLTLADLDPEDLRAQVRYFYVARDPQSIPSADPVRCLVCAQPGHMAASCTNLTCGRCATYKDHFTQTCPQRIQVCERCRQQGHSSEKCTSKLKVSVDDVVCTLCHRHSHVESECEVHWRTSGYPWLKDLPMNINISCYECGAGGHLGNDCPTRRPGKALGTSTWTSRPVTAPPRVVAGLRSQRAPLPQRPAPFPPRPNDRRNPINIPDSDEDESFLRPRVPAPTRTGQMQIRGTGSRFAPPNARDRFDREPRPPVDQGGGKYGRDTLPPRPPRGQDAPYRGRNNNRGGGGGSNERRRSRSPIAERGGGRQGGGGRGGKRTGGSGSGDSYRPLPGAAKKAYIKGRN